MYDVLEQMQIEPLKECSPFTLTQAEFDAWKYGYIFAAIKGQRYGQSFCQYFGIVDFILRFTTSVEVADTYIKRTYIK